MMCAIGFLLVWVSQHRLTNKLLRKGLLNFLHHPCPSSLSEYILNYYHSTNCNNLTPLCPKSLRMHPTYQFQHTKGYRAQHFRCPLLFPHPTGTCCDHAQFAKGKGCVKDVNWELGGSDAGHP